MLDAKLRKLDAHPGAVGFAHDMLSSQGGDKKESMLSNKEERKSQITSDLEVNKRLSSPQLPKKSQAQLSDPSRLSFIYDDVTQRMKNIEDFGAPLSQLDRVLLSILVQMRSNLNEEDHPINRIVAKFQSIILENVEKIKYKFRFS